MKLMPLTGNEFGEPINNIDEFKEMEFYFKVRKSGDKALYSFINIKRGIEQSFIANDGKLYEINGENYLVPLIIRKQEQLWKLKEEEAEVKETSDTLEQLSIDN